MRRFFMIVLVAACANHAKQSISLYESGDYAGAARSADQGLVDHPDDGSLWAMKIRASLALGDGDAVAKAYTQYLAHHGDDDTQLLRDLVTATLGQALGSPSVKMKIAAIDAVARIELHALADQVAQRMDDNDDRVAAAAAVAVLKGFPEAPRIADEMAHSPNAEARRIAIDGIGKKVGKLAAADLEKAAVDPDPHVRAAAVYWLGMIKDREAVPVLTRHLRDPDEAVRAGAARALAQIGAGNLAELAKVAVSDHMLSVRLAGIELYTAARRDAELVALTDDADALVAATAAIALKKTHPDLPQKAIARALAAPEWTARAGIANMLVMALGKQAALPFAQKLATDSELGVRLAAARVLVQCGDKEAARRVFTAALQDVQADADLAALGDTAGLDALSAAVHDRQRSSEERIAAAAAHHTAHRITPGLVAALADADGMVRVEAASVLGILAK